MTEPLDEHLADAVSRLALAWSKRSAAERSAFSHRLAAASAPPQQPDGTLRSVRERAALCGAVTPSDLARGLRQEDATRALDLLAPQFDRVHIAGQWQWTLRTGPRRDALESLLSDGRLPGLLAEVAGIQTDRAGDLLRQLAETRSAPRKKYGRAGSVPENDPATAVQALTWARPLGGFDGDLAEARRRAAVRLLSDGYRSLTPHGIFGRERELAELRDFAEGPREEPVRGDFPVPLLPLTGIGGAGKSTVLGEFVKRYLDKIEQGDPHVPAVVVIDFDRVFFRPTAELELSLELTRQLGYAAPVAAADFSALRYQFREEQVQSGSDRHVSNVRSDSATRESSAFDLAAGKLVEMHGLADRRVLLVLDTFEEWQRERLDADLIPRSAPEQRILDWIRDVRFGMGLRNLRVVVSGRASLDEVADFPRRGVRSQLVIGDLDPGPAREMLAALDIPAADAARIVELVGGFPLTLLIAARFYRGLDQGGRRDFLAGDPLPAKELTIDLRNALLYERFLGHIPDEQVRKVAHPGLVLRRITKELVRNLLAGPCGLGELDEGQARQLTDRLAEEVWLVLKTPDGLHHRRDVRRPMLKLMADDPDYTDVVGRIHAAAVSWYENIVDRPDRLPADQARVEALYHSLMLKTGDEPVAPEGGPDREHWLLLAQQLGQAVDELPAKVAAQVRVLREDPVADNDAMSLPDPVWELWIEQRGRALVDNGEPAAALGLFDARRPPFLPDWLPQACSDAAQWSQYWPTVRTGGKRRVPPDRSPLPGGSSDLYGLLNALLADDLKDLNDYQAALSRYFTGLRSGARDAVPSVVSERLFCALLWELGIPVLQRETTTQLSGTRTWGDRSVADRFPVGQLRRAMVWAGTSPRIPEFVITNAASFCRPDPRWMRNFAALAGTDDPADLGYLDSYFARLGGAVGGSPGLSSHQLLGEWSISYARALGEPEIRLRQSKLRQSPDLVRVLRGDNPELRPAIQLALGDPTAGADVLELAGIAERLLPFPAADLRPSALSARSESGRRALVQLVEYIDRSGVMREFLAVVRATWPGAERLRHVADAFDIWDDANNRLLDALANRLRNE